MSTSLLFTKAFGTEPQAVASAPGRVNLIGEHTDYNGGFVLPLALAQRTQVAVRLKSGTLSRAISAQRNPSEPEYFDAAAPEADTSFVGYLKGAFKALTSAGYPVIAADVAVDSDVPIGSGLASSAALLVATLRACEGALGVTIPPGDIAELAYRAEHDFVGIPVGKMDPTACALATTDTALFLNTRSMHYERVALPDSVELVIIDSGIRHAHGTGGYRSRRAQCETAAQRLHVRLLCDLEASNFTQLDGWETLSPELQKRTRHVVSENLRVVAAVAAMHDHNALALGALLNASHASLRDDFAVSTAEVDALVDATREMTGCLGARMTGGGFGGAIIALVQPGTAEYVATHALEAYHKRVPAVHGTIVSPMVGTPARAH
jgi:galactokinase